MHISINAGINEFTILGEISALGKDTGHLYLKFIYFIVLFCLYTCVIVHASLHLPYVTRTLIN